MLSNKDVELLYSHKQISNRVYELAQAVERDYVDLNPLVIPLLKGSFIFAADLVRSVTRSLRIDFLGARSYDGEESSGTVKLTHDVTCELMGQDVLIVEDIVDTGLTVEFATALMKARGARSVKVCTLLDKPSRRRVPVVADYVGFTVGDAFVFGYGLDVDGEYRNLSGIYAAKKRN